MGRGHVAERVVNQRADVPTKHDRGARYAAQLSHSPGLEPGRPLCLLVIRLGSFRMTNVNQGAIALDCACGIAQLVFERVEGEVEHPYNGAFTDEFDYRGVG